MSGREDAGLEIGPRSSARPSWAAAGSAREREHDPELAAVLALSHASHRSGKEMRPPARLAFHATSDADESTRQVGAVLTQLANALLGVLDPEEAEQLRAETLALLDRPEVDPAEFAELGGAPLPSPEERVALRARLLYRYFERRRALLEGALPASDVQRRLRLSEGTLQRWSEPPRRLLAVVRRGVRRYPAWQFDPTTEDGILPGLAVVLPALEPVPLLQQVAWFLTDQPELDGATPARALRAGRVEDVAEAAFGLRHSTAGTPATE